MKTVLPEEITTVEGAKAFLLDLIKNNEVYHPEDDANEIDWATSEATPAECNRLNKLMDDIYNLPGNDGRHGNGIAFCPCGFIIENDGL